MAAFSACFRRAPLFITAFVAYSQVSNPVSAQTGPRIGIVGAGVGGTSCAYFLHELFGHSVTIDVFEKAKVGGRLATVKIDSNEYEAGGAIIHPKNTYMVNLTEKLGLKKNTESSDVLGIYNGKEVVFTGSEWEVITLAKLLWRYGYDIIRLNSFVQKMLKDFNRIYEHQSKGEAFTDVESLLESMSPRFVEMTRESLKNYLLKEGFSERLIDELAFAAMRTNYGQTTTNTTGFVGSISLAGVESGLWAVRGGNKLVPERLLQESKANVQHATVKKVTYQKDKQGDVTYKVDFISNDAKSGVSSANYDVVVIATPLHRDVTNIKFENFPDPGIHYLPENYHRTVATFVKGTPNAAKFGFRSIKSFPTAFLTANDTIFFNSLGMQFPVDYNKNDQHLSSVWKVFSQLPLTDSQLKELFVSVDETQVVDWLAYPHYEVPIQLPKFILHDRLYYLNGIELAASAMEMEVIAGKNIALLAFNQWKGLVDKIDAHIYDKLKKTKKNEL